MTPLIATTIALGLPLLFVALWLAITTLLSLLSGWFGLMRKFPDRPEAPILALTGQSGSMGFGVNMKSVLTLSVCPSGLRIGILRALGPFTRPFFVPWNEVAVARTTTFFMPVARLSFGRPVEGALTVSNAVADRLAQAAMGNWPEAGSK